jgi:hypothetical protein
MRMARQALCCQSPRVSQAREQMDCPLQREWLVARTSRRELRAPERLCCPLRPE